MGSVVFVRWLLCVYFMNCEMGSHGVVDISWFMVRRRWKCVFTGEKEKLIWLYVVFQTLSEISLMKFSSISWIFFFNVLEPIVTNQKTIEKLEGDMPEVHE